MLTRRTARRSAFTIIELMVVMAIVLMLAAILVPSLMGFWGNNRSKAAVDLVTGRLSDARGAAISQGRAYRVSASPDGLQIRVAPDESEMPEEVIAEASTGLIDRTDSLPKGVVLTPITAGEPSSDGWTTLVTFLPDGTCRELGSEFQLAEPDNVAQVVRIRGLTGVWTVNPATAANPMSMGGQP
jgi:prepilin-type N-terminal cleavage/methylation domain-containing protein